MGLFDFSRDIGNKLYGIETCPIFTWPDLNGFGLMYRFRRFPGQGGPAGRSAAGPFTTVKASRCVTKVCWKGEILPQIIVPVIFAVIILVARFIISYNRFIEYRNKIEKAWSGIDVALKRRFNMIPNLIRAIEGY